MKYILIGLLFGCTCFQSYSQEFQTYSIEWERFPTSLSILNEVYTTGEFTSLPEIDFDIDIRKQGLRKKEQIPRQKHILKNFKAPNLKYATTPKSNFSVQVRGNYSDLKNNSNKGVKNNVYKNANENNGLYCYPSYRLGSFSTNQ